MSNINSIAFYKPNSKNSGIAASFNAGAHDGGLYVSFIRQFSWNGEKKTGSFKENAKDDAKKKNIKLNEAEAGGIIRAIDSKGVDKWSSFHKFGDAGGGVGITFAAFERDNVLVGYGLRVVDSKDKDNAFSVGFTLDEAIVIREYLREYLVRSFYTGQDVDTSAVPSTSES